MCPDNDSQGTDEWLITPLCASLALQGHWATSAGVRDCQFYLRATTVPDPNSLMFGCVCLPNGPLPHRPFPDGTSGILLHQKRPTEADSCHALVWWHACMCACLRDRVCVLPDSGKGRGTLVLQTRYLVSTIVTNHFRTDIKRLAAWEQRSDCDSDVTDWIYFSPESFETLTAAEITELGGCLGASSVTPIFHNA